MRPLTIMEHISLDGVIQNTSDDDHFRYGDWTAPFRTPEGRSAVVAAYGEKFDLVLGRRTYDLWSGYWPTAPGSPLADGINRATKYVVTHREESLAWGPVQPLGPDFVEGIRRIKSQRGPKLMLNGSSSLTSTLMEHGLADELLLAVYPVLLGTGKRMFENGFPAQAFKLERTQAFPSGIVFTLYTPTGAVPRT